MCNNNQNPPSFLPTLYFSSSYLFPERMFMLCAYCIRKCCYWRRVCFPTIKSCVYVKLPGSQEAICRKIAAAPKSLMVMLASTCVGMYWKRRQQRTHTYKVCKIFCIVFMAWAHWTSYFYKFCFYLFIKKGANNNN